MIQNLTYIIGQIPASWWDEVAKGGIQSIINVAMMYFFYKLFMSEKKENEENRKQQSETITQLITVVENANKNTEIGNRNTETFAEIVKETNKISTERRDIDRQILTVLKDKNEGS